MKKTLSAFLIALTLFLLLLWKLNQFIQIVPTFPSLTEGKAGASTLSPGAYSDGGRRFAEVKERITPHLEVALEKQGLTLGSPVFLRSFKEERELELWILDPSSEKFIHAHTWAIRGISGHLGPKIKEGDKQSPEGFYTVGESQLLPSSTNHLAFNVGFPNRFDQAHHRTGSFIMIHGRTGSIGCLAMTDPFIEEIYTICEAALSSGSQSTFPVHMFPFRMTEQNMQRHQHSEWFDFWENLKEGYDYFEIHQHPPKVSVSDLTYSFS